MASRMWFGNDERMQWINCALREWDVPNEGYSEVLSYVNGGKGVVRSFASARSYDLTWAGTPEELNPIKAFQQGVWGPGPFRIVDPMSFTTNVIPPNWATPRLIEMGDWKNIYDTEPTFSDTAANTFNQPARTATWNITTAANGVPSKVLTIPIPPSHGLYVEFCGALTGAGVVRVRPINSDGSYGTTIDLTAGSVTGPTRSWESFNGYVAVQIYLTRTSTATSTISIASMMGQLWPLSLASPTLTNQFIPGDGIMGLEFTSGIHESYRQSGSGNIPARKSASVLLTEVEPWL